jgi:hypothetical protein
MMMDHRGLEAALARPTPLPQRDLKLTRYGGQLGVELVVGSGFQAP